MKTYEIEGKNIRDETSFVEEVTASFISKIDGNVGWSGNLDAFNDYLTWPEGKYQVVFRHSENLESTLGPQLFSKILEIFHHNKNRVELQFK